MNLFIIFSVLALVFLIIAGLCFGRYQATLYFDRQYGMLFTHFQLCPHFMLLGEFVWFSPQPLLMFGVVLNGHGIKLRGTDGN